MRMQRRPPASDYAAVGNSNCLGMDPEDRNYAKRYKQMFDGYRLELGPSGVESINPEDDAVTIRLTTKGGDVYVATFATLPFIERKLREYRVSGESAGGTYFSALGLVVIRRITEETVRTTVNDLIDSLAFHEIFHPGSN